MSPPFLYIVVAATHVLLLLLIGVSEADGGSRSILRSKLGGDGQTGGDYAVDINATNFDNVFKETPASFAVLEFFAHWCPACRNYKPHYEKVARLFNGPNAVHPGVLLMTRVDCALKRTFGVYKDYPPQPSIPPEEAGINNNLCDKFSVGHYPMLFWGPPSKFSSSGGWQPKDEKSEIRTIDDGRTADHLLKWINQQLGSSYNLDDQKFVNDHLAENISDPGLVARAVYDVEEATTTALDIILQHKMINSATHASLMTFLQLLVAHHPSKRCRKGSADILVNFDDLNPPDVPFSEQRTNGKLLFEDFQICGKEVPRGYWLFCRGSRNETRGFSCGLWVLLHSISVRISDGESQFAFTSICEFIHNFFVCEECRQHFSEMCSSVESPFKTSRDFALWLWSAHNKVNDRLMKEEAASGPEDPKFPKIIWPPKQLCSSCPLAPSQGVNMLDQSAWNLDEVYKFLTNYYGKTLVSLYKDKDLGTQVKEGAAEELVASTNAIMVPLGAALAIAIASCAFGALACYWRSQQKSRKPRRKLDVR